MGTPSPMMCWVFIWAAMKVVSMRTYCKRLSMGLTIQACQRRSMFTMGELLFREEERVIEEVKRLMQNDQHLNWIHTCMIDYMLVRLLTALVPTLETSHYIS